MRYQVRLTPELQNDIAHFHPLLKKKIKSSLKVLQTDLMVGKPLLDELEGFWSYPVSHHRIIYKMDMKRQGVKVVMIAPRFEVYELLLKKIKKK